MATVLAPADSLVRVHGRGSLLSVLEKETLLTRLRVAQGSLFAAETMDWDSYWGPLGDLGCQEAVVELEALRSAWQQHIRSGFSPRLRRELCFRYFSLLDALLGNDNKVLRSLAWAKALQAVLGFECFGISRADSRSGPLGAGTCTLRNPCYLLAKLKMPNALGNPQFLPLITIPGAEKPELFYHYRQYNLASNSGMALLLYPAVSEMKRSASFELIASLIGGVSDVIDPRTRQRGRRLFQGVLRPMIQARRPASSQSFLIEFVDVGAGSGSLSANLCLQIQRLGTSIGILPKVRLWFVDLQSKDTTRFFRAKAVRSLVDSLMFVGEDYRDWLSKPSPLPMTKDLRIALVSKLFNNLSRFSVRRTSSEETSKILQGEALLSDIGEHAPSLCLMPNGKGVEALAVSPSYVSVEDGRTTGQISLSGFFQGLFLLLSPERWIELLEKNLFLPIRAFNPDCLVTSDGRSVLACLVEHCDYVLVEDADLSPNDLVDHMRKFALHSIAVHSLGKSLGLVSNHAYVLWAEAKVEPPDFQGERLW